MTKEQLGNMIIASEDHLYRVAKLLLNNDADCADAIQEAIVKAFSKLHTLRNDKYARTWLIRILMNECYTTMRKEKKFVSLEAIQEGATTEENDYTDLYQAVSKLPADLRVAVLLYYSEGYSVKEIAAIEDTTESAIKNRLHRARTKLRGMLAEEEACNL
ncbi:MAG: RNA polymerase sigma factor [Lachnospiraceae bacterium]|jgi:RNA polymerase sigma-70 factor (ECF subfamily)|nr:RNA polymerase sigma factor [Lachnospiraceae bacterium]MDD3617054.1 RNA polymerase sigma factor [Lachnospiraceae bacterium]